MATAVPTTQTEIIAQAMKDPSLRARLIAQPKETLEKALGVVFPADVRIRVVEEAPDEICLVLPSVSESGDQSVNLGLKEVVGFASAGTYTGCGACSVTAPETSRACGCR